jgi:hypothetical protein
MPNGRQPQSQPRRKSPESRMPGNWPVRFGGDIYKERTHELRAPRRTVYPVVSGHGVACISMRGARPCVVYARDARNASEAINGQINTRRPAVISAAFVRRFAVPWPPVIGHSACRVAGRCASRRRWRVSRRCHVSPAGRVGGWRLRQRLRRLPGVAKRVPSLGGQGSAAAPGQAGSGHLCCGLTW